MHYILLATNVHALIHGPCVHLLPPDKIAAIKVMKRAKDQATILNPTCDTISAALNNASMRSGPIKMLTYMLP